MTEANTPSKSFKIVHNVALVVLFLMMAQPTVGNVRALLTGTLSSGDISIEVTLSQMILHVVAMAIGWLGLWWFFKRQKRGAYLSIAAHGLGMVAVLTQTPAMLEMVPPAALAVFFVVLLVVALGPLQMFKDEYS
ncbi:MAG TPA: hypothetical protein DIU15_02020 [Deltaproteobacteria bacterium]|nr:hypothetical protein [Deltaproteobacteria bacterium]HCP44796.1 hypothetical protein [Deltaproteobacteria bacterium]|tara:strand:- start:241 stop:645 length:405 start_codon:yes stop_codon:yes gene_type:complete